jgi:hypothetical protein
VLRDGIEVRADPRGPDSERFPILSAAATPRKAMIAKRVVIIDL